MVTSMACDISIILCMLNVAANVAIYISDIHAYYFPHLVVCINGCVAWLYGVVVALFNGY